MSILIGEEVVQLFFFFSEFYFTFLEINIDRYEMNFWFFFPKNFQQSSAELLINYWRSDRFRISETEICHETSHWVHDWYVVADISTIFSSSTSKLLWQRTARKMLWHIYRWVSLIFNFIKFEKIRRFLLFFWHLVVKWSHRNHTSCFWWYSLFLLFAYPSQSHVWFKIYSYWIEEISKVYNHKSNM